MLRDEARAEHLQTLARDLLHDGRIVHEPPAAKRQQVAELTRVDAQLVLILAAQDANEKTILGKLAAERLE
jgi:hypothetical protein